jgi:PAS domain S-box-containing protein
MPPEPVAGAPIRLLYADKAGSEQDLVCAALDEESGRFVCTKAASSREFEAELARGTYDVVLTDFDVLGLSGLEVLGLVQARAPRVPVVVVTGSDWEELAVEALRAGAADYVIKSPTQIRRLPSTLRNILGRHEALLGKARADEELRHSQARLELAMAAGHMGVFDWDLMTGRVVWEANHAALFGLQPGDFDGTYPGYARLVHPDDLPEIERATQASRDSHSEFDAEYRVVWPDGSVHWVAPRGRFWYDDDGRAMRMSGVVMDVDRRRTAEEMARQQQAELAHLLRLSILNQLASGLAHEINQPLTAISNFAGAAFQLHKGGRLTPERAREVIGEMHQQSQRAGEIVRRMRGFMKKRGGGVSPCDVNALAAEAVALMKPELAQHNVRARLVGAPHLPPVPADGVQIQQVLVNLIQNAIDSMRNAPAGRRSVTITTAGSLEQVIVRVTDTGIGIPAEDLPRVFDSFFSTKSYGLGMGLNISRSIIETHGGRLTAENNPNGGGGGGATFEFVLPLGGSPAT